jgi:hypothetical protein
MNYRIKYLLANFFFLLICLFGHSQDDDFTEAIEEANVELKDPNPIQKSKKELSQNIRDVKIDSSVFDTLAWKKAIEGLNYYELEKELLKSEKILEPKEKDESKSSFVGLFQVILIILVLVILGFLIYQIALQARKRDKKLNDLDEFWQINLNDSKAAEAKIEDKLKDATGNENYIIAIRLNYLLALNELNKNSLVKWKKDKTNSDYVKELRNSQYHSEFRQLTIWFERAWFGRFTPDAQSYEEISYSYRMFIDKVKTHSSNARVNEK